ncbi:MAG: carotenoid 1,2-hydratase [Burkholderiales bacterium]|nr:carotenoid 1,2-hydratase [Burkholderiales bacterium]MCE7877778.1 carotenoid 1,2-hydratase [Betaproteobacteria bacterium PRO3]
MRRRLLQAIALALSGAARGEVAYPDVPADVGLAFPRDHGSHPTFRTEWWYVTGWTTDERGVERGVQVTFFRSRPGVAETSASAFAPRQLLFAHAAIADATVGHLVHGQRAAREGFGVASAAEGRTDVRLDRWTLAGDGTSWRTRVGARAFTLDLGFRATQPPLPQGDRGRSRKGPRPEQASAYYSVPHLAVDGELSMRGEAHRVAGTAWLDHEWSSAYLAAEAAGWDWIGLNLDDGAALMAFRIRGRDDSLIWSGGTLRDDSGRTRTFAPDEVAFLPGRRWRSPRTGIAYPVAFEVRLPGRIIAIEPLMDDQELDARGSVGIVYWEGAVRASTGGRPLGRGYLELTGYGVPLRL